MAMTKLFLPEDLAVEILSRLPVKSLTRIKCVCKTWCALIRSDSFISKHLNLNTTNRRVTWNDNSNGLIVAHDSFHVFPRWHLATQPVNLKFGLETKPDLVLGPCDGIFCLHWISRTQYERIHKLPIIALWNPATREFNMLPTSSFDFPPYNSVSDCIIGFGFDRKTKSYKVVQLVCFSVDGGEYVNYAEVYTSNSGSWRGVPAAEDINVLVCSFTNDAMYTNNGVYHWSLDQNNGDLAIVSFDMGEEVFRVTPLPKKYNVFPSEYASTRKDSNLTLLNESLAVICMYYNYQDTWFELWVMKDYNYCHNKVGVDDDPESESYWSREFTVGPFPGLYSCWGFWKSNELLILRSFHGNEYGGCPPFLYDLVTKKCRDILFSGEPNFIYKESLVSVKAGNHGNEQYMLSHKV